LSLKINGCWEPWVYVKESTIENGGKGLFSSRKFKNGDTVTYFMGRKLSIEELNNKNTPSMRWITWIHAIRREERVIGTILVI
jgi:hypothetical protein